MNSVVASRIEKCPCLTFDAFGDIDTDAKKTMHNVSTMNPMLILKLSERLREAS